MQIYTAIYENKLNGQRLNFTYSSLELEHHSEDFIHHQMLRKYTNEDDIKNWTLIMKYSREDSKE